MKGSVQRAKNEEGKKHRQIQGRIRNERTRKVLCDSNRKCSCMKNICKVNFQRNDYVGDVVDAQLLLLLLLWANNNNLFWFSNWRKCDEAAFFLHLFFSFFSSQFHIHRWTCREWKCDGFQDSILWKFQSSRQIEAIIMITFCERIFSANVLNRRPNLMNKSRKCRATGFFMRLLVVGRWASSCRWKFVSDVNIAPGFQIRISAEQRSEAKMRC